MTERTPDYEFELVNPGIYLRFGPCYVCGVHRAYYVSLRTDHGERLLCGECIAAAVKALADWNANNALRPNRS